MDAQMLGLATGFGLSASAGLNTTLPLLLVGLLARIGLVDLRSPYDALADPVALGGLFVLAVLEFVGDKVPALDSVVHAVQWPLAATAGAILFASQSGAIEWVSPGLAVVAGVLTAGAVHGTRMAARPLVTAVTGGMGNPAVSTTEDAYAVTLAGTSLLAPALGLVLLLALVAVLAVGLTWAARRGARLTRWLRG